MHGSQLTTEILSISGVQRRTIFHKHPSHNYNTTQSIQHTTHNCENVIVFFIQCTTVRAQL
ncbi:hypothetical protein M404DRAFT_1003576 [Pisolithus tinctorius Marx 270]|uniref:Uncharacterized protein n=1 Tax=Pisolithus tinctorius Marx 270 TaxID=870435 RepID=A0A0C3JTU9_PISTI|nr:hypothetical protein M404DRAFT_1003576 [Pisolithus tinctorius Marx 270]